MGLLAIYFPFEVFDGILVYVLHQAFSAIFMDVEVFEFYRWAFMNGSIGFYCDGCKGVDYSTSNVLAFLLVGCILCVFFFSSVVTGYQLW